MLGDKGISPLIAAVILIAFVIAVAGIASTFFTGFTKEQKAGVESKAGTIIDCSLATIDLDEDTISIDSAAGNFTLVLSNTGQEDLSGLKVIFFNSTYAGTCTPDTVIIDQGETITLTQTGGCLSMPNGTMSKVQVTTTTCAGVKSELTNQTDGTWKVTA